MRVLGIDPGSRRTGYGVVERRGNADAALDWGLISASPRLELARRLHAMHERVAALIDEWKPDCVAVEEAFYHESVRSTLVLGHVRGALLVAAAQRGVEVAEYTPRSIKLAVAGTGAATKEQVAFMVRKLVGVHQTLPLDVSDGIAVALCHLHRAGRIPQRRAASAAASKLEALLERRKVRS
jgi:crossover junction endodeoxyribonuclease RuvC